MNTRLLKNPEHIFDVFVILSYSSEADVKNAASIQEIIPSSYNNNDVLQQIPKFAYPCRNFASSSVEHYTFVLTDVEAKFHYGFCRLSPEHNSIYCLLSRLPWFDAFYQLMNKVTELTKDDNFEQVKKTLNHLWTSKVPAADQHFADDIKLNLQAPDLEKLPTIPANRNLTEFYSALNQEVVIDVFASLLNERRILITSKKLSKLTACCHAASALLYPCHWQHLFIPVLPESVVEFVLAPMPYIIGVHSSLMEKVRSMDLTDAVILNVDHSVMEDQHADRKKLPPVAVSELKKALKSSKHLLGDNFARAFLRCIACIIGAFQDGLKYTSEDIEWDEEQYISKSSTTERSWRELIVRQQYFSQFIEERLERMKLGKADEDDEFDKELSLFIDKSSKIKYKEWLAVMKNQGKVLKIQGQKQINNLGRKAKDVSKKAYKELWVRLRGDAAPVERQPSSRYTNNKINYHTEKKSIRRKITPPRPELPVVMRTHDKVSQPRRSSYDRALKYTPLSFDDTDLPVKDTDLLNDPDIKKFLHRSSSSFDVVHIAEEAAIDQSPIKGSDSVSNCSNLSTEEPIKPPRRKKLEKQGQTNPDVHLLDSKEAPTDQIIGHQDISANLLEIEIKKDSAPPVVPLIVATDTFKDVGVHRDLLGLDLSPCEKPSLSHWTDNKPTTSYMEAFSSTNPFSSAYTSTLGKSSSFPGLPLDSQSSNPFREPPLKPTSVNNSPLIKHSANGLSINQAISPTAAQPNRFSNSQSSAMQPVKVLASNFQHNSTTRPLSQQAVRLPFQRPVVPPRPHEKPASAPDPFADLVSFNK